MCLPLHDAPSLFTWRRADTLVRPYITGLIAAWFQAVSWAWTSARELPSQRTTLARGLIKDWRSE